MGRPAQFGSRNRAGKLGAVRIRKADCRRVHRRPELPRHPHERRHRGARRLVRRRVQRDPLGDEQRLARAASHRVARRHRQPVHRADATHLRHRRVGDRAARPVLQALGTAVALHRLVRRRRRGAHRAPRPARSRRRRAPRTARRATRACGGRARGPADLHASELHAHAAGVHGPDRVDRRSASPRLVPVDVVARHPPVAHPQAVALHACDPRPRRTPERSMST